MIWRIVTCASLLYRGQLYQVAWRPQQQAAIPAPTDNPPVPLWRDGSYCVQYMGLECRQIFYLLFNLTLVFLRRVLHVEQIFVIRIERFFKRSDPFRNVGICNHDQIVVAHVLFFSLCLFRKRHPPENARPFSEKIFFREGTSQGRAPPLSTAQPKTAAPLKRARLPAILRSLLRKPHDLPEEPHRQTYDYDSDPP